MFYANGDQYVGKFHRGHLSGRGVLKYARGESYDGNFFNGFMYGGTYISLELWLFLYSAGIL